jgi:FkbM family methyltransferase
LRTGYETLAFEPNPRVFGELTERCEKLVGFRGFPIGVGGSDGSFEFRTVETVEGAEWDGDLSLYSSFTEHDLPKELRYSDPISVGVRSLGSLHASGEIPLAPGMVKIDTEGGDLAVIEGLGEVRPEVIVTETWADGSAMGGAKSVNALPPVVAAMRERGYHWFIHIFRKDGTSEPAYFVNWDGQPRGTWGNTFFFREVGLFRIASEYCERMIPRAPVRIRSRVGGGDGSGGA